MRRTLIAAALAFSSITTLTSAQGTLDTDEEKTLYALGVAVGANIQQFALSAAEFSIVESGIRDSALGSEPKVDMETYGPLIQALANARTAARSAAEKQGIGSVPYGDGAGGRRRTECFWRNLYSDDGGHGLEPDSWRTRYGCTITARCAMAPCSTAPYNAASRYRSH